MSERPSFSAPLWAAVRQGGKEFAQILPAFPESVRVVEEPGTLGNPTQYMVTEEIQGNAWDAKRESYAPAEREPAAPEQGRAIGDE